MAIPDAGTYVAPDVRIATNMDRSARNQRVTITADGSLIIGGDAEQQALSAAALAKFKAGQA